MGMGSWFIALMVALVGILFLDGCAETPKPIAKPHAKWNIVFVFDKSKASDDLKRMLFTSPYMERYRDCQKLFRGDVDTEELCDAAGANPSGPVILATRPRFGPVRKLKVELVLDEFEEEWRPENLAFYISAIEMQLEGKLHIPKEDFENVVGPR